MPSGQPQYPDIDALLRGAKRSLANANTLQAEIDTDARSMPLPKGDRGFLSDLAAGLTEHPRETLSGVLEGAKDPAKRIGARLAENVGGMAQGLFDPVGASQEMGRSFGQRAAQGQTPTLSEGIQFATGIDPSSDYPEMAADALTAVLFARGMGTKGPELGRAPSPRFAVEPRLGPSEFSVADGVKSRVSGRIPQNEGPIPVSSVPKGTAAERFAPNRSAGNFTGDPNAAAMPFQTGVDPYMPNTGAASLRPDFYAGADPIPPVVDRYAPNRGAASSRPDFYAAADPFSAPVVERYAPNISTYVPEPVVAPVEAPAVSPEPSIYPGLSEWLAKYADAAPSEPVAEPVPTVRDLLASAPEPDALPEPIDTTRYQLGAAKSLSDILPETALEPVAPPQAPRPKLAANEVAKMLEGRQRFSDANPNVELAPGQLDELDRLGVEYGRTQGELKRLLGMADADPVETGRMRQGARELGSRLRSFAKNAASPTTIGATAALPIAAAIPDDPESDWDNYARAGLMGAGILGMAHGAMGGKPASKIFADVSSGRAAQFHDVPDGIYRALRDKLGIQAAPDVVEPSAGPTLAADMPPDVAPQDMHRFMSERGAADLGVLAKYLGLPIGGAVAGSLLSDDAGEGALGGAALGGAAAFAPSVLRGLSKPGAINAHQTGSLLFSPVTLAKIATSNTSGALMKAAERGIEQGSFSPVSRMARELVDVPQLARDAREAWQSPDTHNRLDIPGGQSRGVFGAATRAVGSLDAPFRKAMERAGMSSEDALTITQQREPTTQFGKDVLNVQRGSSLGRFLFPFMKSPINAFETGVVEPIQSAGRLLRREGTRGDAAKVAMAAGAAGAGALADDALSEAPPWLQGLLMAMTGPYAVSAGIGRGLAKGTAAGAAQAVQRSVPLGQGVNPSAKGLLARLVPRIFWDYGDK